MNNTTGSGPTGPTSWWARGPLNHWAHPRAHSRTQQSPRPTPAPAPTRPGPRIVVAPAPTGPTPGPRAPGVRKLHALAGPSRARRAAVAVLAVTAALLLASVVIAPSAMSSQDIIGWARSDAGLLATGVWPYVAFWALDAAAVYCVLMGVYATWIRGESPGAFRWGVWIFAAFSATANYAFAQTPGAGRSQWWFYPAMSLLGPALLEVTMHRVRRWVNEGRGRRAHTGVTFALSEWLPITGHFRETYGAWRLARFVDMTLNPDGTPFTGNLAGRARFTYRVLCPRGDLRVFKVLRAQQAAALDGVDLVLPGLIPADVLAAITTSTTPQALTSQLPPEWGTDPRDRPVPVVGPECPVPAPAGPTTDPTPAGPTTGPPGKPETTAPDTDEPDEDDTTAAGVEISEDEVNRLLARHAERLFAIREAYGTDTAGKTWLDCTPAISRRTAGKLAGLGEGRAAREIYTCLKHLRADRAAVAKIPTTGTP